MANLGGLKFNKMEKTRILPLRWIGNACNYISTESLVKAFDLQEQDNFGYRAKFHALVWKYLDKPYQWWGTYYKVDDWWGTYHKNDFNEEEMWDMKNNDCKDCGVSVKDPLYWETHQTMSDGHIWCATKKNIKP